MVVRLQCEFSGGVSYNDPHMEVRKDAVDEVEPREGMQVCACSHMHPRTDTRIEYSSTCHGRPPLVQRKNGPSWQVAPRDRERTHAPLCQFKQTHQTAYI